MNMKSDVNLSQSTYSEEALAPFSDIESTEHSSRSADRILSLGTWCHLNALERVHSLNS